MSTHDDFIFLQGKKRATWDILKMQFELLFNQELTLIKLFFSSIPKSKPTAESYLKKSFKQYLFDNMTYAKTS